MHPPGNTTGSGISRQLFNWVQVIKSNCTGVCMKLAGSIHVHDIVILLIV